ncbi:hypothetical protein RDABS01_030165 [Bienertia sinuspersici]
MKLVKKTHKKTNNNNNVNGGGSVAGNCFSGENSGGRTVVVGVRLDQQSKELLTWALMKVAQPGDLVVALHVLHSSTVTIFVFWVKAEVEQSMLISLVKTFDSTLAVYEGFCHLKQVDLKLKVCRGTSLRKILVREAKAYDGATLVLGACKAQHMIRSPTSVAKYCAKKLPNNFSVFAVDSNCKTSRLVSGSKVDNVEVNGDGNSSTKSVESTEESCDGFEKHTSGARRSTLIKRQIIGFGAISSYQSFFNAKFGCKTRIPRVETRLALVRQSFLPRHHESEKVPGRKTSMVRRVLRISGRHSSMAVHPDRKRRESAQVDDQFSDLSAESGAIVPVNRFKYFAKELEGFHDKYSSSCRLFAYQELLTATSNFAPGLFCSFNLCFNMNLAICITG